MLEIQQSTLDMQGASRLDQIRASMAGELTAGPEQASPAEITGPDATVSRLDEIRASLAKEKGDAATAG